MKLESLGWSAFAENWTPPADPDLYPARVVSQQRGRLHLLSSNGACSALLRGNLIDEPPVVGDWVLARAIGEQHLIERILPRQTQLERQRVGGGSPQILAANVQRVAAVTSVGRDFNPRRLERYQAAASGAGCQVMVVLSKADLVDDLEPYLARLQRPPIVVSANLNQGVEALRRWIGDDTAAFIGTSGVGKSTLINRLVGREVRATGATSVAHGKGRHTTTSRDLLVLPGGGCVIDTPGMREFGLSAGASTAFEDVDALGAACAYRDCAHDTEPGCAVQEAVCTGLITAERVRSYKKLIRELERANQQASKRLASNARKARIRKIRSMVPKRKKRW